MGGARPHRVQVNAVGVLEDCFVALVDGTDAIDLGERPAVPLEGLGLRPAARQDAPDGVEEPLLARFSAAYFALYDFFSALLGAMLAFCFVR